MGVFVGFSRIFLLGILIFKGITARRLYMSFGVKGLMIWKGCRRQPWTSSRVGPGHFVTGDRLVQDGRHSM
jgi:hypothetical protein